MASAREARVNGRVYYNEFDAGAADWLEWLIAERLIPGGLVDRRSILDVEPSDLAGFLQCHFFAGIGGWALACRLAGWPADRRLWSASLPCQPFSSAGRRLGADDERHLWPHFFRLARAERPPRIVGEQVAGALGYGWFDGVAADLGSEGYACRAVDVPAAAVDAPQLRQRLYWCAIAGAGQARACGDGLPEIGRDDRTSDGDPLRAGRSDDHAAVLGGRDAQGSVAGGAGIIGERWGSVQERRPDGRTAAQGDDAGELACTVDGAQAFGRAVSGGEQVLRSEASELERSDGGGRLGAALGRAEGRRLEVGQLTGWGVGAPARWLDAAGADDRNGSWWSGADWIVCHDDKARRVADAGAPLLAHGLPGRVVAWRGFGNAIVPPLAAEVIGALMDTDL